MVALAGSSSELPRVILPVPVDAELELNSVIPPPDMKAYGQKQIIKEDNREINTSRNTETRHSR